MPPNKSVQVGIYSKSNLSTPQKTNIKNVNKLNTIKERNNTQKTPYNVHGPEFEVEVGDKPTSGKWHSKWFTCVIASGVLLSWTLVLIDSAI